MSTQIQPLRFKAWVAPMAILCTLVCATPRSMAQQSALNDVRAVRIDEGWEQNTTQGPNYFKVVPPSVVVRSGYRLTAFVSSFQAGWFVYHTADGSPVPGVHIHLTLSGMEKSGGHNHSPRKHGWLFTLPKFDPNFPHNGGPSGTTTDSAIDIVTGDDGKAHYRYTAPEGSGEDVIHSVSPDNPGLIFEDLTVAVHITGLTDMRTVRAFPFSLYGITNEHPENWYAAANTVTGLATTSANYTKAQADSKEIAAAINGILAIGPKAYDFPNQIPAGANRGGNICPKNPEILFINDISLIYGGIFDLNKDFLPGHGGHRDGTNVDLKTTHLVSGIPYTVDANGNITEYADESQAIGDSRLEAKGGAAPFRDNKDWFLNNANKKVYYTPAIRAQIDSFVMTIHYQRLVLLLDAFPTGCTFAVEGLPPTIPHIHVKFP